MRSRSPLRARAKSRDGVDGCGKNGDATRSAWSAHGDLLAGNVLVCDGRLHAVIDWSGLCHSDPAREVIAAWTLFAGGSRAAFRRQLHVDDPTWERAKGWALTRIFNVAYYEATNPVFSRDARRTITEVLHER